LLHRAPAPWARWMRMVKKELTQCSYFSCNQAVLTVN
jgi:hypothetical protein